MNQQIIIWKQSAKILGNYVEMQNVGNSLKQHAFLINIHPNQYI